MNRYIALLAGVGVFAVASPSHGAFVIVGDVQTEQGNPNDWDPPASTLIMAESGGELTYTLNNLANGTRYEYKVLDDGGDGAAWGDAELTSSNQSLWGDADGTVDLYINTNLTNGAGGPVTWVNTDGAPLQVVGSFQDNAGGASEWNPTDPLFAMTSEGNGYYTFVATIDLAGDYEFKATDGTGWDRQVGTDGVNANAGSFAFSTQSDDQQVTLFVDLANRSIGVVPEPASLALLGLGGLAMLKRRKA